MSWSKKVKHPSKILAVDPDDEDVIEAVTAARAEIAPPSTIP